MYLYVPRFWWSWAIYLCILLVLPTRLAYWNFSVKSKSLIGMSFETNSFIGWNWKKNVDDVTVPFPSASEMLRPIDQWLVILCVYSSESYPITWTNLWCMAVEKLFTTTLAAKTGRKKLLAWLSVWKKLLAHWLI